MLNIEHVLQDSSQMPCPFQCSRTDFSLSPPRRITLWIFVGHSPFVLTDIWITRQNKLCIFVWCAVLSCNSLMASTIHELLSFVPLRMTGTVLQKIIGASNVVTEFKPHCPVVDPSKTQIYNSRLIACSAVYRKWRCFLVLSFPFSGPGLWAESSDTEIVLFWTVRVLASVMHGCESLHHFQRRA